MLFPGALWLLVGFFFFPEIPHTSIKLLAFPINILDFKDVGKENIIFRHDVGLLRRRSSAVRIFIYWFPSWFKLRHWMLSRDADTDDVDRGKTKTPKTRKL